MRSHRALAEIIIRRISPVLLLGVALGGCSKSFDNEAIVAHVREQMEVADSINLSLEKGEGESIGGFKSMQLRITQPSGEITRPLYISKDGRYYLFGQFADMEASPDMDRQESISLTGVHAEGPAWALVRVVAYTDFQCPSCKRGAEMVRTQLLPAYKDKIQIIYKAFPSLRSHPWALAAAIGAECAGLEGEDVFWNMHDSIFDYQQDMTLDNIRPWMEKKAGDLGLDQEKFMQCFDKQETIKRVQEQKNEGMKLRVQSTPTFFVNGHRIKGPNYQLIKKIIDENLNGTHGKIGQDH